MALKIRKGNPKAKVTGTTYKSSGQPDVQLKPSDYNEQGSSARTKLFETVPELASRIQESQTYTKMYRNCVAVRIGIRAGEAPVVGGDYYIEPCTTDPEDIMIAEFVRYNLFEGPTVPFKRTIRGICNGLYRSGFKVLEDVWELREWAPTHSVSGANRKQYTMLAKLAPRPSDTIKEITYDANGGPTGVIQTAIDPSTRQSKEVTIPIEKIVIFPFEEEDGDLMGTSILRPAFLHYTFLEPLYKLDGIQKEHHAIGIPDIKLHAGYTADDKAVAHLIGNNLRTNERAYVVSNDRFDVKFIELQGQPIDILKSAEFHDTMILKSILLQFLNMGVIDVGGGGRATAATALDVFMKSMRYVGESICDGFNNYVIPKMVAYNFNTDRFPKLKVRNIGETKDLQMWAAAMANLIAQEAIQVDEDTENFIRDQVDFPKRTTPRKDAAPTADPTTNGNTKGALIPGAIKTGNVGKPANSAIG